MISSVAWATVEAPENESVVQNPCTDNLDAPESATPFDVCVIGSGFAGATVARELVEQGARVAIVESGGHLFRWFSNRRIRDLALYEVDGITDYPRLRTRARALGGTSNFWTGRAERLAPSDFDPNPYTPAGAPWPISYADLDPYYERAERTLRVRGAPLSEHYPPSRAELPLPARSDNTPLKTLMGRAGITLDNTPTATPANSLRTYRVSREILPDLTRSRHVTLLSGLTITRLVPDEDGRIVAAEGRTLDGGRKTVHARYYVVAVGGIESPRLLMLSRSEKFPNGIGNRQDRVGRGFTEHPGVNFYGRRSHDRTTIYPHYRIGRSRQHYDAFRAEGLGSVLLVAIQSWAFPNHLIQLRPRDLVRHLRNTIGRIAHPELYVGATIEMIPTDENRITLSDHATDQFGMPLARLCMEYTNEDRRTLQRTRELIRGCYEQLGIRDVREGEVTWSRHHMGACRMGDDPRTSVTDRHQRVHESPNLYIAGCEVFVTGGAGPPVLTNVALSHRLGDHLVERLKHG